MHLTGFETLVMILALAAGTQLTRWLPFWLFPENKEPPAVVAYLSRVLPPACMGLLVVYCLKGVSWLSAPHGAAGHRGGGDCPQVEGKRSALHRRRHGAIYAAGAGDFCISF